MRAEDGWIKAEEGRGAGSLTDNFVWSGGGQTQECVGGMWDLLVVFNASAEGRSQKHSDFKEYRRHEEAST